MQGETNTSAQQRLLGSIDEIRERLETDPDFSRRSILKGMAAISVLTALQGMGALKKLPSKEQLALTSGDICPDYEIECYLKQDNLDVPAVQQTPEIVAPTSTIPPETTQPPTTLAPTTTAPPPPPPPTAPTPPPPPVQEMAASSMELPPAPRRDMSYQEFSANAELFYSRLPNIDSLQSMFPGTAFFQNIPELRQHIDNLRQAVQPTPEAFINFSFNKNYSHMFQGSGPLDPRMVVWHWTGNHYDSPEHLANSMRGHSSVQTYVHSDAIAYQLVPDLNLVTGHARCLNPFSWGIEIYTGAYDGSHSPVFNYTKETTETGIYVAVNRLRNTGLPVNHMTLMGHNTADLIFMNPYYDPYSGTFHEVPGHKPPYLHKYDPPQEFMDMVVHKAAELDAMLGPR
jgi:hypothetical protein